MSIQTLYITKRCYIKAEKDQLVIEGQYKVRVPVEDISSVVIESQQVTITSACLSLLAEHGCNIIICGKDHKPNALQLPFLPHSRQSIINRKQIEWPDTFKKRCHQKIIQQKIINQAKAIKILKGSIHDKINELSKQVKLSDKTNVEAVAASWYFKYLLKGNSRRNKDYYYNKALNYGYSVIRSRIAQVLTVHGFIPSIGIFHKSELNNFNLADDVIEPYRPFVDYYVFSRLREEKEELDKEDKSTILKILEVELINEDKNFLSLSYLIKQSIQSLRKASDTGSANLLFFPDLQPMKERTYE